MTSSATGLSSLVRGFTYDRLVNRLGGQCGNQISAIFLSMSLNSDEVVRESKGCLVQSGDDSSEETTTAVVTKRKRKKVGVRSGRAMNSTKHLWAGAIAAMVSRTFVAPLERLKLEYNARKQLLCFSKNKETTNFERFVAGAAAGITVATLCLPLDTEWQGWGTASPIPAMVTKIVEDLKA
ncbi:hypothetical protein TB2_029245 [Malus domestica]